MRSWFGVAFPWALLALGGSVLAAVIACSSSASTVPCNEDPFQCGAGTTCWPSQCVCPTGQQCDVTNCVPQFSCVASVPGKQVADSCHNTTGNSATCGDHQACIELAGLPAGICAAYCDPTSMTHGCDGDDICSAYRVGSAAGNPTVNVCIPKPGRDGGPDPFLLDSGNNNFDDAPFDAEPFVPDDGSAEAQPHSM
jgi:hypothetical protein